MICGVRNLSALVGLLLLPSACGSSTSVQSGSSLAPKASQTDKTPVVSGWDYHPRTPAGLRTRITLDNGAWLFAGVSGERWMSNPKDDLALTAPSLADEELVAILRTQSGGFSFVGAKGSLYRSADPLGPFTEVIRPTKKLVQVAGQGSTLIGVQEGGGLVRSGDGGKSYSPVRFEGGRVFDLAVASEGRVLILTVPEQIWESADDGLSFKPSSMRSIGAMAAKLDAAGDPVVQGLLQSAKWERGTAGLKPLRGRIEDQDFDLLTDPKPGANGAALGAGSASLEGTRYVEAIAPVKQGMPWTIVVSGLLGRAKFETPIAGSDDCTGMQVSASGEVIVLGCLLGGRGGKTVLMPPLRLYVSKDGGMVFDSKPSGLVADDRRTRLRLLPSGTLLITGACRTMTRRLCQPTVPVRIPLLPGRALRFGSIEPVTALPMPVQALGLEATPKGDRVYWAGRLAAGRTLAVQISEDDGLNYKVVPLDLQRSGLGSAEELKTILETAQPEELGIDAQGNLSLILTTPKGALWVVLGADAKARSAHLVPEQSPKLAAAGMKGVGYDPSSGVVQVSQDGGASFERIGVLPRAALSEEERGIVSCRAAGCAFGAVFSWQGWGKASGGLLEPLPKEETSPSSKYLTPIVCRASGQWNNFPRVDQRVTADEADRAGVAWSVVVRQNRKGAVRFALARSTPKPHVEMLTVFEPGPSDDVAVGVNTQQEGMAALRYPVERDQEGEIRYGRPMRNIDVAWVNLYQPGVHRARIAELGVIAPEDASGWRPGEDAVSSFSLLSSSIDGLFVCPHGQCEDSERLGVFVDSAGRSHPLQMPKWPPLTPGSEALSANTTISRVDGRDLPLAYLEGSAALGRAHFQEGAYRFEALTFLPLSAQRQGFRAQYHWAFSESRLPEALSVSVIHPTESTAYAHVIQFQGTDKAVGTIVAAPTQSEVGDPPRACTAVERKSTYRILAPVNGGLRHPVRVDIPGEKPEWLYTDDAILYGKGGAGCLSVYDAVSSTGSSLHALIDIVNMRTSWLFNNEPGDEGPALNWATMECSFDPSVRPPDPKARDSRRRRDAPK